MRLLFHIVISLLSFCMTGMAQTKTDRQPQSLVIINGVFFSEKPEQPPHDYPIKMGLMKDEKFGKIIIMNYDKPLSDEAMALAIPVESIANGADILKRSKEATTIDIILSNSDLNIKTGDIFPEFRAKDNKGKEWTLSDFIGHKTVINFWYTGCKPCRHEMPELGSWVAQYPDVLFVAVTYESADKIENIVKENGFHFHQLTDAGDLVDAVGVGTYPLTLVLDENARIILIEIGTTPVQRSRIVKAL